jgi:hypothetical protein
MYSKFLGELAAGGVGFAFDAVLIVDGEDVFLQDGVADAEGFGHFIVGAVAEEHVDDGRAAGLGALVDGGRAGDGELEFFGEGGDVRDALLFADQADGAIHSVDALAQLAGDLEIGRALAQSVEDFFALGRFAIELAGAGPFSFRDE